MYTRNRAQGELVSLEHNLEATLRKNKGKKPELSNSDSEGEASSSSSSPTIPSPPPSPRMADQQSIRDLSSSVAAGGIPSCIAYT